jgi:3-oxoacyl-[acyl-carrier protein] reductase
VIGLAKDTGLEYADTGITVNSLSPAMIMTEMARAIGPELIEGFNEWSPMKR